MCLNTRTSGKTQSLVCFICAFIIIWFLELLPSHLFVPSLGLSVSYWGFDSRLREEWQKNGFRDCLNGWKQRRGKGTGEPEGKTHKWQWKNAEEVKIKDWKGSVERGGAEVRPKIWEKEPEKGRDERGERSRDKDPKKIWEGKKFAEVKEKDERLENEQRHFPTQNVFWFRFLFICSTCETASQLVYLPW